MIHIKKERDKEILEYFLTLLLISAIILSLLGFYRDFKNTIEYGGIDLRPKVVGSRLLMEGYDPYHYKWSPGDSESLLDPNDSPDVPISRVTVTPAYLVFLSPIANIPYKIQKIIWLAVQWLLFLFSLTIFANSAKSIVKSKIIWIIGLLFISVSSFWRLHVERGQIYIVFVFLLSLAYLISQKKFKYNAILSGFLIGYTISLRPPIIFMTIPILIYRQWKLFIGTMIGLLFGIATPLLFSNISIWERYYSSMQYFGTRPDALGIPWGESYRSIYPDRMIEGMNNLGIGANIETSDSSLQAIFFNYLGKMLSTKILTIALIIILLIISILLLKFRIKKISMNMLFLVGITIILIGEFFLPAANYNYTNITWLIPLSLIIASSNSISSLIKLPIIFLITGLFLTITPSFAPGGLLPGSILVMLYIILSTILLLKDNWQNENMRITTKNTAG